MNVTKIAGSCPPVYICFSIAQVIVKELRKYTKKKPLLKSLSKPHFGAAPPHLTNT